MVRMLRRACRLSSKLAIEKDFVALAEMVGDLAVVCPPQHCDLRRSGKRHERLDRNVHGLVAISIDTAILANANDPGRVQAWVFVMAAALCSSPPFR